jgi:hypothetical protein
MEADIRAGGQAQVDAVVLVGRKGVDLEREVGGEAETEAGRCGDRLGQVDGRGQAVGADVQVAKTFVAPAITSMVPTT